MCFREDDDVSTVRTGEVECTVPLVGGQTVDVEEKNVETGGGVEVLGGWVLVGVGGWWYGELVVESVGTGEVGVGCGGWDIVGGETEVVGHAYDGGWGATEEEADVGESGEGVLILSGGEGEVDRAEKD